MGYLTGPIQRWIWRDPRTRGLRLLHFAEVEADSGRDVVRAAELTNDARLRGLYLRHASDERHHAEIFRTRGRELLSEERAGFYMPPPASWMAPGERGLDDVRVEPGQEGRLLAFLHLSERNATVDFARYRDAHVDDRATRAVFERILCDEEFHMTYTRTELARVAPDKQNWLLWRARLERLWKAYLRFASWLAGRFANVVLTLQYFILLPPFAWAAKRAARREPQGWFAIGPDPEGDRGGQY